MEDTEVVEPSNETCTSVPPPETPCPDSNPVDFPHGIELWVAQRAKWRGFPEEEVGQEFDSTVVDGHTTSSQGFHGLSCNASRPIELTAAERLNIRGCLVATSEPYPPLRRKIPLALAVHCAHELWGDKAANGDDRGAVERLAEAARAGTQDLMEKSAAFGSNIAKWGQVLYDSAVHALGEGPTGSGRTDNNLVTSLRNRGGISMPSPQVPPLTKTRSNESSSLVDFFSPRSCTRVSESSTTVVQTDKI